MAEAPVATLVHRIRALIAGPADHNLTDRQLLQRFSRCRDESAFALVVRRHGPVILGLCRRILHCEPDAEDAFQATFLVLAKKAGAIRWQESVGAWLYDVASRVARRAKADRLRGRVDERRTTMATAPDAHCLAAGRELQAVLDEEVQRLPEKYRLPVILCCLEGVSRSQAATQLGWREGTVAGRLARARELLQRRLTCRGVTLSAVAIFTAISEQLGTAAVPGSLAADTVRAAARWSSGAATTGLVSHQVLLLANGTLHALALARCKRMAVLLLVVVLGASAVTVATRTDQPSSAEDEAVTVESPHAAPPAGLRAQADLQGGQAKVDARRIDAAVSSGLKWLARHQALDGHWGLHDFHVHGKCNCTGSAQAANDTDGTSLGLLALLGAGETHKPAGKNARYAKSVERGLRWLCARQNADGLLSADAHAHGLATLALCSAYGMTGDPVLKGPAQRALNHLVAAQPNQPPRLVDKQTLWLMMAATRQSQFAGLHIPNAARPPIAANRDLFRDFCTSLARECVGKEYRQLRGDRLAIAILEGQDQGADADHRDQKGSWPPPAGAADGLGGRLAVTALMLLTLEGGSPAWTADRPAADRRELTQSELTAAWEDLRSPEFLGAHVAMLTLIDCPKQTVPFLNERLQAVAPPDPQRLKRIDRLIADLDARRFATRQKAFDELAALGEEAEGALRKALKQKPSLELQRRLEALLEKLGNSSKSREWKAVTVLFCIGTPEARRVLLKLSKGSPLARLTQEAQDALDRLANPHQPPNRIRRPAAPEPAIVPFDRQDRIGIGFSSQQRFGIVCLRLRDPRDPEKPKLLTHSDRGHTNSTCLRIDGRLVLFGSDAGRLVRDEGGKLLRVLQDALVPGRDPKRSAISVWDCGKVRVVQSVEVVVGEQTRLYDTALVKYRIENRDDQTHTVGLRFLLDACIGANTGAPFYVPPTTNKQARLVDTTETIPAADMPPFLRVLETADLGDGNATVAEVGLQIKGFEALEKAVLCRWPEDSDVAWGGTNAAGDWRYQPINQNPHYKDSCLLLYWATRPMKPGEQRDLAFTYGLGRVSQEPTGK